MKTDQTQSRRVARNVVRNVLAGADSLGKMTILRDVLANLAADGVHMGRLLRELEAEAAATTAAPACAADPLIPASEPAVEGTRTVMDAVVETVFDRPAFSPAFRRGGERC